MKKGFKKYEEFMKKQGGHIENTCKRGWREV